MKLIIDSDESTYFYYFLDANDIQVSPCLYSEETAHNWYVEQLDHQFSSDLKPHLQLLAIDLR